MTYQVGVDLGTTYTAAAVCRSGSDTVEPVPLGERSNVVSSAVFAGADGAFLVGEAAERRALSDPDRVVREFKRRIGDATPVLVGREPVAAEDLAARFIARVLRDVAQREGGPAARVAVTHPVGWGPHKVESLRAALAGQGVGPVLMLSEPQAAAVGYASTERVEPGAVVAVYDLGGGTFDAAVVGKTVDGFELLGHPEGLERLGGADFDEAVFEHVRTALGPAWAELDGTDPEVLAAVARLRRECTAAKEVLSVDTEVMIPVMLPGTHTRVRLGRAEFEEMIRPAVLETVEALRRAVDSAGVAPLDVTSLLLVGGSSRIPLVTQLVSAGIGRPAAVDVDPKGVIAAGAALAARGPVVEPAAALAVPADSADPTDVPADVAAEPAPPVVVSRPPKQARPFRGAVPTSGGRRAVLVAVAASVLTAVLVGGALALDRIGRGNEADASIPPATPSVVEEPSVATPPPPIRTEPARTRETPARREPPAQPEPAPPPATTSSTPPVTTPDVPPATTGEDPPVTTDPPVGEPGGEEVPGGGAEDGGVPGDGVPEGAPDAGVPAGDVPEGSPEDGGVQGGGPSDGVPPGGSLTEGGTVEGVAAGADPASEGESTAARAPADGDTPQDTPAADL